MLPVPRQNAGRRWARWAWSSPVSPRPRERNGAQMAVPLAESGSKVPSDLLSWATRVSRE